MTQHQIARFCFKVLAVYAVILGVGNLSDLGFVLRTILAFGGGWDLSRLAPMFFGLAPVAQIGLGVWLWKKAGVVAAWATGHDLQDDENEPVVDRVPWSLEAVQMVVFSSFGVWVLIHALPDAVNYAAIAFMPNFGDDAGTDRWEIQIFSHLLSGAIRIAIGFWLVFGASNLARLIHRRLEDPTTKQGTSDT